MSGCVSDDTTIAAVGHVLWSDTISIRTIPNVVREPQQGNNVNRVAWQEA